jgi:hypothetical protein
LSIEYVFAKFDEFDRIKDIVFDQVQLDVLNNLPKRVFKYGSQIKSFATSILNDDNTENFSHLERNIEIIKNRINSGDKNTKLDNRILGQLRKLGITC